MNPLDYVAAVSNIKAASAAQCLVDKINGAILFPLIALMSAFALLVFLYGCFEYVRNADSDSAREMGQRHILYGIIGLLVMLSAFAILSIAAGTFGLGIDRVNCNDASSPTSSGLNSSSFTTAPNGGFNGGTAPGVDTTNLPGSGTSPGIGSAGTLSEPGNTDSAFGGSSCVVEDRTFTISCGSDPACQIAKNQCETHYDVQSSDGTGGRWQDIPPIPGSSSGSVGWSILCTYSVAVCS